MLGNTSPAPRPASVDFTMMYVAHDVFNGDLDQLIGASQAGSGFTPAAIATWRSPSKQLHTHHNAEDAALWPACTRPSPRPADNPDPHHTLQAEHAPLDYRLEHMMPLLEANVTVLLTPTSSPGPGPPPPHHHGGAGCPSAAQRATASGWLEAFSKEILDE